MRYAMPDADERPFDEIVACNGAGKCGEVVEGKDLQGRHRPASGGVLVGKEELLPKIETEGNASDECGCAMRNWVSKARGSVPQS